MVGRHGVTRRRWVRRLGLVVPVMVVMFIFVVVAGQLLLVLLASCGWPYFYSPFDVVLACLGFVNRPQQIYTYLLYFLEKPSKSQQTTNQSENQKKRIMLMLMLLLLL